jgi:hypothetical protein
MIFYYFFVRFNGKRTDESDGQRSVRAGPRHVSIVANASHPSDISEQKRKERPQEVKPAGMRLVTMTRGGVKAKNQAKATKMTATVKRSGKTKNPSNSTQIGKIPMD